jgi:thiol-disulfide isomerase/thioredoxin
MTMDSRLRRALGALSFLLAATTSAGAQEVGLAIGATAPAAAVETLAGQPADLQSVIGGGKPTVIEFWATWCGNCKELEPAMEAAQRRFGDRVRFVGVAVSVNQSPERVRRYVAEHLPGFVHFYDRRGLAIEAYDVPATSYVVVLDKDGKVVYGAVGGRQDIAAAIALALR